MRNIKNVVTSIKATVVDVNQAVLNELSPEKQEQVVDVIRKCSIAKFLTSESWVEKSVAAMIGKKVKKDNSAICAASFALLDLYTDARNVYQHGILKAAVYRTGRGLMYRGISAAVTKA